ncbi:MAG TPA: hypothetical protein VJ870_19170 [Amycolatopsis sp.]|nr:hypothetical protein [Amycolatopsis sp.]
MKAWVVHTQKEIRGIEAAHTAREVPRGEPLSEIPLEALEVEYQRHDIRAACTTADEVPPEDFRPPHGG